MQVQSINSNVNRSSEKHGFSRLKRFTIEFLEKSSLDKDHTKTKVCQGGHKEFQSNIYNLQQQIISVFMTEQQWYAWQSG